MSLSDEATNARNRRPPASLVSATLAAPLQIRHRKFSPDSAPRKSILSNTKFYFYCRSNEKSFDNGGLPCEASMLLRSWICCKNAESITSKGLQRPIGQVNGASERLDADDLDKRAAPVVLSLPTEYRRLMLRSWIWIHLELPLGIQINFRYLSQDFWNWFF